MNPHLDAIQLTSGTSLLIFVGLLVMMYPVLAKVLRLARSPGTAACWLDYEALLAERAARAADEADAA